MLRSVSKPLKIFLPIRSFSMLSLSNYRTHTPSAPFHLHKQCVRSFAKAKDKKGSKGEREAEEPVTVDLPMLREKMDIIAQNFKAHIATYKVGRATPDYLSQVKVKIGKTSKLLPQCGLVSIRSAQLMVVTVLDPTMLDPVLAGLKESSLNLNPTIQQNAIHVPIPKATKDQRDEITKLVKGKMEETKGQLRKLRQESLQQLKKSGGSKDDVFRQEKDVQKVLDQASLEVDKIFKEKETELNTV